MVCKIKHIKTFFGSMTTYNMGNNTVVLRLCKMVLGLNNHTIFAHQTQWFRRLVSISSTASAAEADDTLNGGMRIDGRNFPGTWNVYQSEHISPPQGPCIRSPRRTSWEKCQCCVSSPCLVPPKAPGCGWINGRGRGDGDAVILWRGDL